MKKRSGILKAVSAAILTAFMLISSGFTVIIHECHDCGNLSVKTQLFVDHNPVPADCCCNAESTENGKNSSCQEGCCETRAEQGKTISDIPEAKISVNCFTELKAEFTSESILTKPEHNISLLYSGFQKPGGRQTITSFCCLII